MQPTPSLSHFTRKDYLHIYEPQEDTFLLLDALEQELPALALLNPTLVLEVGYFLNLSRSGSGCVSAFLGGLLPRSVLMATDINADACTGTLETCARNNRTIDSIRSDLGAGFQARLEGLVDVLVFNPPYVVTAPSEVGSHCIDAAWAGGINGRQVIDRFMPIAAVLHLI